MQHIGYYFGMPKQIEMLFLTIIGIGWTIYNISTIDLNSDLQKVWQMEIDNEKISPLAQLNLKYFLCGIILTRAWSAHLYLASYLVIVWPILFEERPFLLIPWLTIGAIRTIGTSLMSFATGIYICLAHNIFQRPACLDFGLSIFVDYAPSYYMWFLILSFLHELKLMYASIASFAPSKTALESEITIRRRKVRSMADGMYFKHHCPIDEDRHLISVSTIENIIQQLTTDLQRKTTRSLDSLLGAKAAEAEKEELMSLCEELPNEEAGLSVREKTLKLFKLTSADILSVKKTLKKDRLSTKSLFDVKKGNDETEPEVINPAVQSDTLKSTKSENGNNLLIATKGSKCKTNFMSEVSETEIGSVLNYSTTESVEVLPKKEKVDKLDEKQQKETKMVDFGCQVSTLSRNILNAPPASLLKPMKYIKTVALEKIVDKLPKTFKENQSGNKWEGGFDIHAKDDEHFSNIESPLQALFQVDGYATEYKEKISKEICDNNLISLAKNLIFPNLNRTD